MALKANINEYRYNCPDCGMVSTVKSNQPAGGQEPLICECYTAINLILPDNIEGKSLYTAREETQKLQRAIISVIASIKTSMTVRQIFYRLVSSGFPKNEDFYIKVQRTLLDMRERGLLPYGLIADNTRSFYKPRTYSGLENMLNEQQRFYRRDFWEGQPIHLEIWLEKEALRNVFRDVTDYYQVPLYVSKGLSSVSFVYSAAEEIKQIGKPTVIYFFSDYDPTGLIINRSIEKRMREFGVDASFIRGGLTLEQIEQYGVEMRETKHSKHSQSLNFQGDSAELDALHPNILKEIVRSCIESYINRDEFNRLKGIETAERQTLERIKNNLRHAS